MSYLFGLSYFSRKVLYSKKYNNPKFLLSSFEGKMLLTFCMNNSTFNDIFFQSITDHISLLNVFSKLASKRVTHLVIRENYGSKHLIFYETLLSKGEIKLFTRAPCCMVNFNVFYKESHISYLFGYLLLFQKLFYLKNTIVKWPRCRWDVKHNQPTNQPKVLPSFERKMPLNLYMYTFTSRLFPFNLFPIMLNYIPLSLCRHR